MRRVLWKEGGVGEAVGGGARDCIFDGFGGVWGKKRRCLGWFGLVVYDDVYPL